MQRKTGLRRGSFAGPRPLTHRETGYEWEWVRAVVY